MQLITKRLRLRELKEKDLKDVVKLLNNKKISRYLETVPYPYKMKNAKTFLKHCKNKAKEKPRKSYPFFIELKQTKKIIGAIGLNSINRFSKTASIGYWLGQKYWRQGYMGEAITKILDFAFNKIKLRRINVEVYTENKGSNAIIKKMGFVFEGTARKDVKAKATGKIHDLHCYGLLKKEWKNK